MRGHTGFLPPEYHSEDPEKSITLFRRGYSKVVDRHRDDQQRRLAVHSQEIDKHPLEVIVTEYYQNGFGFGIGHYVYDPLTERWFLLQRWGKGEISKRKQEITPYVRYGVVAKRQRAILEKLEKEPAATAARPEFALAN